MNSLPMDTMAWGHQRRGAQCSCIGCIGLRPALDVATEKKQINEQTCYLLAIKSAQ